MDPGPDVVARTETWFVSRGIPHFIDRYSASQDVFTRAAPALALVALIEVAGAPNFEWAWWVNVLAVAGGAALLLGAWVAHNLLRGRAPLERPRRVDAPVLAVFVLAPALLPVVFGGQLRAAAVTALGNLVLLGVIYLGTSYGVVPMSRWAAGRLGTQLGAVAGLLVRALPLLLLFVTFLFINAEVWQVASSLDGPYLALTAGLFFAVGTVFLLSRIPRETQDLAHPASTDELGVLVRGTPVEDVDVPPGRLEVPPLSRRQWGNVGLVMLVAQGVQVLLVAVVLGLFFVVLGLLAVTPATIESWTGSAPEELLTFSLFGRDLLLTRELLQVAAFLAAFAGLYFTVYVVTDATYREEFFDEVVGEVRQAFAVRAIYLACLGTVTP